MRALVGADDEGRHPMRTPWLGGHPAVWRALRHAFVGLCIIVDAYLFYLIVIQGGGISHDSAAYWAIDLADPYTGVQGEPAVFLYAPAFAQLMAPTGLLPWPVFLAAWTVLQLACVVFVAGRQWPWVLALPPVFFEVLVGNVHLLFAAAIVLGFRYPWTWSLMLLTKVTPGVGLLWFAVRREWRALLIALGVTAIIAAVSFVIAPGTWRQWIDLLATHAARPTPVLASIGVPLVVRLPVAAILVVWGARTERPWVLPIAVYLAQPTVWLASLSILIAILPLRGARGRALAAGQPAYPLGHHPLTTAGT
jgi:hypothetical protein